MSIYTEQFTLSNSSGQISTTLTGYDSEAGNSEFAELYTFPAATVNGAFTLSLTAASLQAVFLMSDRGGTITTNGVGTADQQTITITASPTGGTFPINFNGQVTDFPWNVSAATVQTQLRALSTIG